MKQSIIFSTSKEEMQKIFDNSSTKNDILLALGLSPNSGTMRQKLNERIDIGDIDTRKFFENNKNFIKESNRKRNKNTTPLEEILVKVIKFAPDKLTKILCERFFSENNCGVKSKFVILTVINRAVEEISEYYQNNNKPKVNLFHPYFINVIFPLPVGN